MFNKLIVLLLFVSASVALCSPVVPESRLVDWRQAGLQFDRHSKPIGKIINITCPWDYGATCGATPDDDSDDDGVAINDAVEHAKNVTNGLCVIYFPPGTYHIKQPIKIRKSDGDDGNIVFIGAGTSTVLHFPALEGYSPHYPFQIEGQSAYKTDASSNMTKGQNTIQVQNASGIGAGDWIYVHETTSDHGAYVGQIFKVVQTVDPYPYYTPDIIVMDSKASMTFRQSYGLKIYKITPVENIGIENLKIYRKDTKGGDSNKLDDASNVFFNYAVNCWIKGVYMRFTFEHHIRVEHSSHLEITGCRLDNVRYHGGGGHGYGVDLAASSTECLVENNIISHCRHQLVTQKGANTNVIAYNYTRDEQAVEGGITFWNKFQDICLHDDYSFANLFEGNRCVNIYADDTDDYGNGPYNTFLRNYTDNPDGETFWLVQAATFKEIDYVNFIATQHTDDIEFDGHHDDFLDIYTLAWNWNGYIWTDYDIVEHNENISGDKFINEISYYYCDYNHVAQTTIPDFLAVYGCTWPPIGPDINVDMNADIESVDPHKNAAYLRDKAGTKTYNPDPIISAEPEMTLPSEINTKASIRGIFHISGSCKINNGITLKILSQSTIKMHRDASIITENGGKIHAEGYINTTEGIYDYVRFIRYENSTPWSKIELRSGGNIFKSCIIDGARTNIYIRSQDNKIYGGSISGATRYGLQTNTVYGTSNTYSSYKITSCDICDNHYGIYSYKSNGGIIDTWIYDNDLYGLKVSYSKVGDIYSQPSGECPYFKDNAIFMNGTYGISIGSSGYVYNGYGFWGSDYMVGHNKIVNNGKHEIHLDGILATLYGTGEYKKDQESAIYDDLNPQGDNNKYIYNYAKTSDNENFKTMYAQYTYWGSSSAPSSSYFAGGTVDRSNHYSSDPTDIDIPSWLFSVAKDTYNPLPYIDTRATEYIPVLSQNVVKSIASKSENINIIHIKKELMNIRNVMRDQKNPDIVRNQISEYFRIYNSFPKNENTEKVEIINFLAGYTAKLKELSNSEYGDINAPFTQPTAKGKEKLLAERAAMHEIFMLHGERNYAETLKRIDQYEKYIQNYDNRRELLSYKMDTYYSLGRYEESYATLKELKKFIRPDKSWAEIPTYEEFEWDLCQELGIEFGLLDEQVETEYLEELANLIPAEFALKNNYPNPFNPETTIPFDLHEDCHVSIKVFNVLGQLIATLTDAQYTAGSHTVKLNGQNLASGMYIIQAYIKTHADEAKNYSFTQKMLLMK